MATLKNTNINDTGFLRLPVGTSAQRPASPTVGDTRYNTDESVIEIWDGSNWQLIGKFVAEGGSVTTAGGYKIHTFTGPGTFSVTSGSATGELLLIAGGGSGGSGTGGGGGAGGVIYNSNFPLTAGDYGVTVGAGGPFRPGGVTQGIPGNPSVFGPQTATGGGRGGNTGPGVMNAALPGGSGGGHAGYPGSPQGYPGSPATGVPGQGTNGGLTSGIGGGGGGGYSQAGAPGSAGKGGNGGTFSTSGTSQTYAGGGGGCYPGQGQGGTGGGGIGYDPGGPQNNATFYGSGGGGGWDYGNAGAGAGYQGLVIVRYPQ